MTRKELLRKNVNYLIRTRYYRGISKRCMDQMKSRQRSGKFNKNIVNCDVTEHHLRVFYSIHQ